MRVVQSAFLKLAAAAKPETYSTDAALTGAGVGAALPAASYAQYRMGPYRQFEDLIRSIKKNQIKTLRDTRGVTRGGQVGVTLSGMDYKVRDLIDARRIAGTFVDDDPRSVPSWVRRMAKPTSSEKWLGSGSVATSGTPVRHGFVMESSRKSRHGGVKHTWPSLRSIFHHPEKADEMALFFEPKNSTRAERKAVSDAAVNMTSGRGVKYDSVGAARSGIGSLFLPRLSSDAAACSLGSKQNCGSLMRNALSTIGKGHKGDLPTGVLNNPNLELKNVLMAGDGRKPSLQAVQGRMLGLLKKTHRARARAGTLAAGIAATGLGSLGHVVGGMVDKPKPDAGFKALLAKYEADRPRWLPGLRST